MYSWERKENILARKKKNIKLDLVHLYRSTLYLVIFNYPSRRRFKHGWHYMDIVNHTYDVYIIWKNLYIHIYVLILYFFFVNNTLVLPGKSIFVLQIIVLNSSILYSTRVILVRSKTK